MHIRASDGLARQIVDVVDGRECFACAAGEITTSEPTIDMPRPAASAGSLFARSARSMSYSDSTVYMSIGFLTSAFTFPRVLRRFVIEQCAQDVIRAAVRRRDEDHDEPMAAREKLVELAVAKFEVRIGEQGGDGVGDALQRLRAFRALRDGGVGERQMESGSRLGFAINVLSRSMRTSCAAS
jgi:hypothetical protein